MTTCIRYPNTEPLHPLPSAPDTGLHTLIDEGIPDPDMHRRHCVLTLECPDCLTKTQTLSTLVDKQCMIHKASKELERVTAGEGVCVG